MNTLQKSVRFGLVVAIIVGLFVVVAPQAFAQEGDGCDFCGSYDSTYTPGYDSTYTPGYDSTYTPGYDSTYWPGYDSTYTPGYDSTYTPGYDSTYTPGYDSTYTPGYDSTYWSGYDSTYTPGDEWEPVDVITNTYADYDLYDYTIEEGVAYSEQSYGNTGYASGGGSSSGGGFSMPSFGRAPSTSYAPWYPTPQPQRPVQQQQQQQQQQQGGQPINIVNTNNNNNVNTNTNVNTAPVTPVYQTPVTYPVQYVYPQQPVYPTYPTYPTQNTYCVITATQGSIANGQPAYLSWSSSGATSAWLSDGIGQVAVNGSLAVRPNVSKTYTLTVVGVGGTNTCNAYVTVQGSYISLSQIPYTGFDAGIMGNAIYWLSLISFAVAGAYLAVYYVPGTLFSKAGTTQVLAFANSAKSSHQSEAYETVRIPEESKLDVVEAPVETMTPSPVDVMENLPVAPTAKQTTDSMTVEHSKEGDAPRIVINRN